MLLIFVHHEPFISVNILWRDTHLEDTDTLKIHVSVYCIYVNVDNLHYVSM